MSVNIKSNELEVFKFQTTGIVSLCYEVVDFYLSGDAEKYNVDRGSARFVQDDSEDTYKVVFNYRKDM